MTPADGRIGPVLRLAPAKLNLTLAVIGQRPDGYHALHSVMVPLGLADMLSAAPWPGAVDTLHVAGRDAGPVADNLVLKAATALRRAVVSLHPLQPAPPALAFRLEKRIPVAAGLGGGSSDAAATLEIAVEAWQAEVPPAVLQAVAASVGSDVPFFLAGGAALVEGRGERVAPLPPLRGGAAPGVLLLTPAVPLPTPDVFAAYAGGARPEAPGAARSTSEHLAGELQRGIDAQTLLTRAAVLASANDLLEAAIAVLPGLRELRRGLSRLLGRPVGLAGSGPTQWVLYASEADAAAAAASVQAALGDGRLESPGGKGASVVATCIGAVPAGAAALEDRGGRYLG